MTKNKYVSIKVNFLLKPWYFCDFLFVGHKNPIIRYHCLSKIYLCQTMMYVGTYFSFYLLQEYSLIDMKAKCNLTKYNYVKEFITWRTEKKALVHEQVFWVRFSLDSGMPRPFFRHEHSTRMVIGLKVKIRLEYSMKRRERYPRTRCTV